MEPKVSICIPCYKQTKYLKLCLDSVLKQTFKDYEVIISDDTPDSSIKDLIAGYVIKDLNYYHNPTALGSPANWNAAIAKAKGKYIKVLHHDDYFLDDNSLEQLVEAVEKNKADFVFCNTEVWYTSDDSRRISAPNNVQLARIKEDPSFLFFRNKIGAPSATLFLNKGVLFDENLKWLVDVDFYIRYLKNTSLYYVNEALICTAHETPGQITQAVQNDRIVQIKEHVLVFNKLINDIKNPAKWLSFFEYLFRDHQLTSMEELEKIVDPKNGKEFYKKVISGMNRNVGYKNFIRRLYNSRFNVLKSEQF